MKELPAPRSGNPQHTKCQCRWCAEGLRKGTGARHQECQCTACVGWRRYAQQVEKLRWVLHDPA